MSNACPGNGQEDVGLIQNSPWRVKRRKENSAPSSPEQVAKRAEQGLFASTSRGKLAGASGQLGSPTACQLSRTTCSRRRLQLRARASWLLSGLLALVLAPQTLHALQTSI